MRRVPAEQQAPDAHRVAQPRAAGRLSEGVRGDLPEFAAQRRFAVWPTRKRPIRPASFVLSSDREWLAAVDSSTIAAFFCVTMSI